jgi:hypothetical protein
VGFGGGEPIGEAQAGELRDAAAVTGQERRFGAEAELAGDIDDQGDLLGRARPGTLRESAAPSPIKVPKGRLGAVMRRRV